MQQVVFKHHAQQALATGPVSEFAPRSRPKPLAEEAAAVADNIISLHEEVERLIQERDQFHNEATALALENKRLRDDLASMTAKADLYHTFTVAMRTRLTTAGKIILDTLSEKAPDEPEQATPAGALAAVEQACTEVAERKFRCD